MTRIADHALALVAAILITATAFHQATTVPANTPAMAHGIDTVLAA
jgi:hypothetical protein